MTATFSPTISLPTPPLKQAKLFINGQWRSASDGKTRPTISPISETAIAKRSARRAIADIPEASEQDVEDAILAARRAFDDGPWAKMTGHERQQILTRASELMEQYADDLALCETLDMGKAIHFAKTIDARLIADLFRYYAGMAPEIDGATRPVSPPPDHTPKYELVWGYNRLGADALGDKRHENRGAKPLLDDLQQAQLWQLLQQPPGDGELWDGPKVAAWMSQTLEQPIHPQRGWEYLRALEMRRRRPRPEHEEAALNEQQQWKKNGADHRTSARLIS